MTERLRIVYIAGAKNCGSTLLDAVLGSVPGVRGLGEIAGFHRIQSHSACACGQPPEGCDPCQTVLSALATRPGLIAYQRLSRLPLKERRLHWTAIGTRPRAGYARSADATFEAVAAATGCRVLVDSSKNAGRAAALAHDSRHDVRVIHLVRDGRGYVQSRRRRAAGGAGRSMAVVSLAAWLAKNALIGWLLARRLAPDRYLLVRYEDLMFDPGATLERIGWFADLDPAGVAGAAGAALGAGVERRHLFEPARNVDYRTVRLDPSRLQSQRWPPAANIAYWLLGGFLSARWGYDRRQTYLDETPAPVHQP